MELVFNDISLVGQFDDVSSFCDSTQKYIIPCMVFCDLYGCSITKSQKTFNSKITDSMTLYDALMKYYCYPELSKLRSLLVKMTRKEPFWEDDKKTPNTIEFGNCIIEAFYRKGMLLSYKGGGFDGGVVNCSAGECTIDVNNATEKRQLLEGFNRLGWFRLNPVHKIEGTSIRIEIRFSETPHYKAHAHFINKGETDCVYSLKTFTHEVGGYSRRDKQIIDDWLCEQKNRICLVENWNYYHSEKPIGITCDCE